MKTQSTHIILPRLDPFIFPNIHRFVGWVAIARCAIFLIRIHGFTLAKYFAYQMKLKSGEP